MRSGSERRDSPGRADRAAPSRRKQLPVALGRSLGQCPRRVPARSRSASQPPRAVGAPQAIRLADELQNVGAGREPIE